MSETLAPRELSDPVLQARSCLQKKGNGGARATIEQQLNEHPGDQDLFALKLLVQLWAGDPEGALSQASVRVASVKSAGVAAVGAEAAYYLAKESEWNRLSQIADEIDPDHFLQLRQKSSKQAMEGEMAEAEGLVRRSLALYPEDADAYATLCNLTQMSGDQAGAHRLLESAPDWFRGTSQYHHRMGFSVFAKRDMEAAEKEFRTAVAMCPEAGSYWGSLSMILRAMSQYDEAERAAVFSLELNPRNTVALSTMASVARHRGKDAEAAEWDRKASDAVPALVSQKILRHANTLIRGHKRSDAISFLQKEVRKNPSPLLRTARKVLVRLLLDEKRTAEARAEWDAASQKDDDTSLSVSEFMLLGQEGRDTEAIEKFDELMAMKPMHTEFFAPAITYLARQGDLARLNALADELIANPPGTPTNLAGAVHALAEAGQNEKARKLFEIVSRRFPENDTLRLLGAVFQAEGGNMRGAIRTMDTLPTHLRPRVKINFGKLLTNPKFWKAVFRRITKGKK